MPAVASKMMTPKAKNVQGGEVDYKAKIDVAIGEFTTKVNKQGEEMGHKCKELKRKLESADDSDLVMEQGKATIKSVKKELRLLQKAEEEQNQGESVSAMVKKLCEAHDEALREIEERESSHFAALQGNDGDDDILSSDL